MRVLWILVCLALVGGWFFVPRAEAKRCGDGVVCACGDTVRGTAVLSADLTSCPEEGLRLKEDAVLDCDGHRVSGSGQREGILFDQTTGAVVRNCRVEGFRTGIRIRGGGENRVLSNEVVRNGRYGIELAKASQSNRIEANLVIDSGDEGIHVGTGSHGTDVVGNEIRGSSNENLYVLSAHSGSFVANLVRTETSTAT